MCSLVTRSGPWGLPDQTHTEHSTMQADVIHTVCLVLSVLISCSNDITLLWQPLSLLNCVALGCFDMYTVLTCTQCVIDVLLLIM